MSKTKKNTDQTTKAFYVPPLGSREEKAEVVEVLCKVGQNFRKDEELMILTTDKAAFSLEAIERGQVKTILVDEGDRVMEGQKLIEYT